MFLLRESPTSVNFASYAARGLEIIPPRLVTLKTNARLLPRGILMELAAEIFDPGLILYKPDTVEKETLENIGRLA